MTYVAPAHRPIFPARKPTKVPLPEEYRRMVRRVDGKSFQIVGLPIDMDADLFPDRADAELWLLHRLPILSRRLKRGQRSCLCCSARFISDGPHNRLCDPCRQGSQ